MGMPDYSDKLKDHFENPRNVGSFDDNEPNVGTGIVGSPSCGDVMQVQIRVDPETDTILEALRVEAKRLRAVAIDGVGPIQRVEVCSVGTDEWFPFFPKDGVFDEQREEIDVDVSGWHQAVPVVLAVRVYDQANNYVVRNVTLRP